MSFFPYSHDPTDKQVNDAAIELCQTDAAGVMMWKDDYVLPRDMSRAIAFCAGQEVPPTNTPIPPTSVPLTNTPTSTPSATSTPTATMATSTNTATVVHTFTPTAIPTKWCETKVEVEEWSHIIIETTIKICEK